MHSLKSEAEAFAIALEAGASDVGDVVKWADRQIECIDHPDWSLCEVSLSRSKRPDDVARLLRRIPGSVDTSSMIRIVLELMKKKLISDPLLAGPITKTLFHMAAYDDLIDDPAMKAVSLWAWDALDLAEGGYTNETPQHVVRHLIDAIDQALKEK
jgi:hypothetical protein